MRYRLRTLLILLAVAPPMLAGAWWWGGPLWLYRQLLIELVGEVLASALIVAILAFILGAAASAFAKTLLYFGRYPDNRV